MSHSFRENVEVNSLASIMDLLFHLNGEICEVFTTEYATESYYLDYVSWATVSARRLRRK